MSGALYTPAWAAFSFVFLQSPAHARIHLSHSEDMAVAKVLKWHNLIL